ncbi:MAG: mechanosensitive ion channel family protein [Elainellaceae cyanobacterium]
MSPDFLQTAFWNNQVSDYLIAFGILVVGFVTIRLLSGIVKGRLKRWAQHTATHLDDALVKLTEKGAIPLLYLGIFYVAIINLTLHPILNQALNALVLIVATFFGIRLIVNFAEYLIRLYWLTRKSEADVERLLNALIPAIRTAAWALGIIFVLDNLGFDISAVLAGIGIGGVAIALASQGVLQDLFSYFSILFDRPFELGDFIIVGEYMGTVEHVGIKTTRIQSLSGEEIVIANADLTSSRIRNYKRMYRRRVVFQFGVLYETTAEQLQIIPGLVQQIVERVEKASFDRAHFFSYGDFSLNFEVVYYVIGNDYNLYMDVQQEINLQLKQGLEQRGIEFAYPTQVLYLSGTDNGEPIKLDELSESDGNGRQMVTHR